MMYTLVLSLCEAPVVPFSARPTVRLLPVIEVTSICSLSTMMVWPTALSSRLGIPEEKALFASSLLGKEQRA